MRTRLLTPIALVISALQLTPEPGEYPSPIMVRDALAWAASGSPAPYPLRGKDGGTVGVVYTPYVRLAIAARIARAEGRPLRAPDVTSLDVDPLYGGRTSGWWYLGVRLDATSYLPDRHDYDVVLLDRDEAQAGLRDARIATRSGLPLWIGVGRGMAYRPLMIGMNHPSVYVVAGVDPARLRGRLPLLVLGVDRNRPVDPVIAEGVITSRDVEAWK